MLPQPFMSTCFAASHKVILSYDFSPYKQKIQPDMPDCGVKSIPRPSVGHTSYKTYYGYDSATIDHAPSAPLHVRKTVRKNRTPVRRATDKSAV